MMAGDDGDGQKIEPFKEPASPAGKNNVFSVGVVTPLPSPAAWARREK